MKKLLFLFTSILINFAFIPVQHLSGTLESIGIQQFIPRGKVNFAAIENVENIESAEKTKTTTELERDLLFEDQAYEFRLKFLSEKARIKDNNTSLRNERYSKIIRIRGYLSYNIKKNAKIIEFRSTQDMYPNFSLNSDENSILMDNKTFSFSSKMTIDHSGNAFNSTWTGFVFTNGKSKVVLAQLKDNQFGILIQHPNKEPQIFIAYQS